MDKHSPRRPEMEPRRASDSITDMGTQTEEQAPEQQTSTGSLTRRRSLGHDGELAQRPFTRNAQVMRSGEQAVAHQYRDDRGGGAPAVRLDMDLDVDIKLQAKIKGEIELSILNSEQASQQRQARQQ